MTTIGGPAKVAGAHGPATAFQFTSNAFPICGCRPDDGVTFVKLFCDLVLMRPRFSGKFSDIAGECTRVSCNRSPQSHVAPSRCPDQWTDRQGRAERVGQLTYEQPKQDLDR